MAKHKEVAMPAYKPLTPKELRRQDAEMIVRRKLTTGVAFDKEVKRVARELEKIEKNIKVVKK